MTESKELTDESLSLFKIEYDVHSYNFYLVLPNGARKPLTVFEVLAWQIWQELRQVRTWHKETQK